MCDPVSESRDTCCVNAVEARGQRAVQVDHRDKIIPAQDRNDQLRPARGVARDVSGKSVDILDQLGLPGLRGGAANALPKWNADARRLADERTEHEHTIDRAVETRPVEIGQELPDQCGNVGHVGNRIGFFGNQRGCGLVKRSIELWLGWGFAGSEFKHRAAIRHRAIARQCNRAYLGAMNPILRKILIALGLIVIALGALGYWVFNGNVSDKPIAATMGKRPTLVEADSQRIPSVGVAKPIGWKAGEAPVPAKGLTVTRFAEGLDHPRTLLTLPNGDVLVAETNSPPRDVGGVTGAVMGWLLGKAGAGGPSPDRIVLLRDLDGDGKAEQRFVLREEGLASPSGMALGDGKLYIANHDALLAFDFTPGETAVTGEPRKLMDLPGGGNHWMRNILLSPDGKKLYIAVGSSSNIGENGMEAETGRAAIWEYDIASGSRRQYANGLRNPNGLAWNPSTGELWTTVNERDMLGPDLVPDYLTNVPVGAQYGWPWVYWKDVMDWRVDHPLPEYLNEYTRKPEYALGAHTAALGLLFSTGGNLMGPDFANGAFIARHGSWNRHPLSGYDVIFVPFDANGNPSGDAKPVLTGFLKDQDETRGRPVWVQWDKSGALLVSDDTAGIVWRVLAPGATPSVAPKPVVVDRMPPQRQLKGDPTGRWQGRITDDYATF